MGRIRAAGGEVEPDQEFNPRNPYHCCMSGITPQQAEEFFTPAIDSPSKCL